MSAFIMVRPGPRNAFRFRLVAFGILSCVWACGVGAQAQGRTNQPAADSATRLGEALRNSTDEQQSLSDHLRQQGALFYGAWWCPACFQQKNLFGEEAGNRLPYVECDKDDAGRERCAAAEIRAYPTWEMEGKARLEGVQSLEELKRWSDFE